MQLNEGLRIIGSRAFQYCTALRSVAIPSTVTGLGALTFCECSNLSEVIFLDGKRLLRQEFFSSGIFSEGRGLINQEAHSMSRRLFREKIAALQFLIL